MLRRVPEKPGFGVTPPLGRGEAFAKQKPERGMTDRRAPISSEAFSRNSQAQATSFSSVGPNSVSRLSISSNAPFICAFVAFAAKLMYNIVDNADF